MSFLCSEQKLIELRNKLSKQIFLLKFQIDRYVIIFDVR